MTAIILAAGLSKRFGGEKLLIGINNKPMLLHVVELVSGMKFEETILVYRHENVKKLAEGKNIKSVYNKDSAEGLSTSIKCGINNSGNTDAYIFFPGDQPFIDTESVIRLKEAFYTRRSSIIVPRFNGRNGNPVIFSSNWKERLQSLSGDTGGRTIIEANKNNVQFVDIYNEQAGMDIDTWEEFCSIKGGVFGHEFRIHLWK